MDIHAESPAGAPLTPTRRQPTSKSPVVRDEVWEPLKEVIVKMHVTDNIPLPDLQRHMRTRYGLDATIRQYRNRISKWDLDKNVKREEREWIVRKLQEMSAKGLDMHSIVFRVRRRVVDSKRICRWIAKSRLPAAGSNACPEAGGVSFEALPRSSPATSNETVGVSSYPGIGGSPSFVPPPTASEQVPIRHESWHLRSDHTRNTDHSMVARSAGNSWTPASILPNPTQDAHVQPQEDLSRSEDAIFWSAISNDFPDVLGFLSSCNAPKSSLLDSPPIVEQCQDNAEIPYISLTHTNVVGRPAELPTPLDDISVSVSRKRHKEIVDFIGEWVQRLGPEETFVSRAREYCLAEPRADEEHCLSANMMKTYLGCYWRGFSSQVPILHRPTFHADKKPLLLVVTMLAIGAACFYKSETDSHSNPGMDLPNYLAWGLRWRIFLSLRFDRGTCPLWALQASLLLEIYERMYATTELHERGTIHHGSTGELIRYGHTGLAGPAIPSPADDRDEENPQPKDEFADDIEWDHWIRIESTRRLTFATFIADSVHAIVFGNNSSMKAADISLPLPCDDAIWDAASGEEVRTRQARASASGTTPMQFLEALKRTLASDPVQTTSFGRTAIMAGLFSLSFHMHRRDLLFNNLGISPNSGVWYEPMTQAFDAWMRDFGEVSSLHQTKCPPPRLSADLLHSPDPQADRTVLYHIAHISIYVNFIHCQIFAGASRLLGREVDARARTAAARRMKVWASTQGAQHAAFHALQLLCSVLLTKGENRVSTLAPYSARRDPLLHRPWALYLATLVLWSYGYARDGPSRVDETAKHGSVEHRMFNYLTKFGGVALPYQLKTVTGINDTTALLEMLKRTFAQASWEFLVRESSALLQNCINMNAGKAIVR